MIPPLVALTTLALHLGAAQFETGSRSQEPAVPEGTISADPGDAGTTEIDGQGKFAAADAEGRDAEDATELEISAGGLLATGNAFAAAVTAQGRLRVRRGIHQFGSQVAANYARADITKPVTRYLFEPDLLQGDSVVEDTRDVQARDTTVANLQAMARYDLFFAKRWSAFLMATARRDRFQGLDLRFNVDPGVAFYALTDARHRLWFEVGYDFQYDIRREEAIFEERPIDPVTEDPDNPPGVPANDRLAETELVRIADDTLVNHAARLFIGYSNSLSDRVSFDTGLEYLQSVVVGTRFRLNWVNSLGVQLADRFGMAVTFTLRYENEPLPNVEKLDTITAVLLTLRFI